MRLIRTTAVLILAILASCTTVENSLYQSNAPEVRGERAIASSIDLVSEVDAGVAGGRGHPVVIGIFYSSEIFKGGETQAILFALRRQAGTYGFGRQGRATTINDYDLRETASLTVDQARELLGAIDNFIATDPATLAPERMLNFELYSGTLDMSAGSERYRPFKEITFIVVFSVTNARKSFKAVFPETFAGPYATRQTVYTTFDLTEEQVKKLREAIATAVGKAGPQAAPATDPKNPA